MPFTVIQQPVGLGDILWLQPIVDAMGSRGEEVIFPVNELYFDMLVETIKKPYLKWVRETDDFPFKEHFGPTAITNGWMKDVAGNSFVQFQHADLVLQRVPVMMAKYLLVGFPLLDWRPHVPIIRNTARELALIEKYDLHGQYTLINNRYGTAPNVVCAAMNITVPKDTRVFVMDHEKDKENGFRLFDWIGAIERASGIHTVYTSICYLADLFASKTASLHVYDRHKEGEASGCLMLIPFVHRHENWVYHT